MRSLWPACYFPVGQRTKAYAVSGAVLAAAYLVLLIIAGFAHGASSAATDTATFTSLGSIPLGVTLYVLCLVSSVATGLSPWIPPRFRNTPCDIIGIVLAGVQMLYWWGLAVGLSVLALVVGPLSLMAFDAGFTAAAFGFIFGLIVLFLLVELCLLGLGWAAACHLCFLTHDLKARRRAGLFGALSFRAGGHEQPCSSAFDPSSDAARPLVDESQRLCRVSSAHVAVTVGAADSALPPVMGWPVAPAAHKV